ncbi:MAG: alpha/beta hydrolase [Geobacteraceae bacterium]|nr:alpha/beta hydrolase [Geobacteraceae bacterium]
MRVVVAILLGYGCYVALCLLAQGLIIYPGRGLRAPAGPSGPAAGISQIWLETRVGRVEAWFLAGEGGAAGRRPALLFFHGNGEIIDFLPAEVAGYRELGLGVMLVEYPGYGRSAGKPSEASITAAALAAYDALVRRDDVDPARLVAFGRSLGCGAACALSRQRPLAALILQSPFTSTRPFAWRFLLPGFLLRDLYDNRQALAAFPGPVLIMHGRYDDIVPFSQGEELARLARNASFAPLACAHNDCPPDWREFWRTVAGFLRRHGVVALLVPGQGRFFA